jgi:hypothetical protein
MMTYYWRKKTFFKPQVLQNGLWKVGNDKRIIFYFLIAIKAFNNCAIKMVENDQLKTMFCLYRVKITGNTGEHVPGMIAARTLYVNGEAKGT